MSDGPIEPTAVSEVLECLERIKKMERTLDDIKESLEELKSSVDDLDRPH